MKTKISLKSLVMAVLVSICGLSEVKAFEETYVISTTLSSTHDKWFGTYYQRTGVNNDILRVGGWGDGYLTMFRTPIHLNVSGRIMITRASLQLYSYGSYRPTTMRKYFIIDNWTETSTTDQWTTRIQDIGSVSAPPENGEYSLDITPEFGSWITGDYPNYGIMLTPENNDNRFNHFLSSENTRGFGKPRIVVNYEKLPDFKLPLPGGVAWKLTVEAGGKQFDEQTDLDSFHTGIKYYSLDFSPSWVNLSGGTIYEATDVPIYASAGGKIIESQFTSANGWYVKIDHDNDGSVNTGFQTVYIHMKNQPLVSVGTHVSRGQQIGIMGNTGISYGVHLHMTFYYKDAAGFPLMNYDSFELNSLRMEGRSIKNYKLGTTWNSTLHRWTSQTFYPSSNTTF